MIFGINFGGPDFPPGLKRKFAARVRVAPRTYARLVGVGQSKAERDSMLIDVNNGHRKIHVVERKTVGGIWYGIYVW